MLNSPIKFHTKNAVMNRKFQFSVGGNPYWAVWPSIFRTLWNNFKKIKKFPSFRELENTFASLTTIIIPRILGTENQKVLYGSEESRILPCLPFFTWWLYVGWQGDDGKV